MNNAHWHLLLNHLPIVGLVFSLIALVVSLALNNGSMRRLACMLFIATSLTAIPAYLTGEPAEEQLEKILPNEEAVVEKHEEQGEIALWTGIGVGVLALFVLYVDFKNMPSAKTWSLLLLLAGLGNAAFMYTVGNSGGEIRHTEIRSNAGGTPVPGTNEHDDD